MSAEGKKTVKKVVDKDSNAKKVSKKANSNKTVFVNKTVSKEETSKKIEQVDNIEFYKKSSYKLYFNYSVRVAFLLVCFVVFFVISILFLLKSLTFNEQQSLEYIERSNLDYQVNLKENDFYETTSLEKEMAYIASLIDSVDVKFDYIFTSTEMLDIDFKYDVVGKLVIESPFNDKVYFEKEYVLLDEELAEVRHNNQFVINEEINVDYTKYNEIANMFKTSYGVDSESSFIVYLRVNKSTIEGSDLKINDTEDMYLTIPLSQKAMEITMDYQNISENESVISEENAFINNIVFVVFSLIFCLIAIVFAIKFIRLLSILKIRNSKYDKYIKKLLSEYDRLIVESYSGLNFENKNIIKIKKFTELLDVRDNLNLPIIYNNVVKHQKSYFYIKHNDDLYLLTIKAVDLEEE